MPSYNSIDLSVAPYWDDYDDSKQFARVLFKPGYPVQARELTQLQTIIQGQIEKFGRHIFEEGSIVYGGQFDIDNAMPFLRLKNLNETSNTVNVSEFIGQTIYGATSAIRAYVVHAESNETDGNVLFIRYLSASLDSDVFLPEEIIRTETDVPGASINGIVETSVNNPTGIGSLFSIGEGVVFSNKFFVSFAKQKIVLSSFSTTPTCKIGFFVDFSIITVAEDTSLLDNSQGFLNYASPGADRLKIEPILSKIAIDDTDSLPEFVELFTVRDGIVQQKFDRPIYAVIGDEIAKRTFDESGDYCVRGMGVVIREHLDTGINEGYKTIEEGGDENLLAIGIEPGLAYVKGYEINTLTTSYVPADKSTDYNYVNSQILSARSGRYITVNQVKGMIPLDKGNQITIYDEADARITSHVAASVSPSGNVVGTARVKSVMSESGRFGLADSTFRVYLYDVSINSGKSFQSEAKAIHYTNGTNHFFADIVLDENDNAVIKDESSSVLLYPVGSAHTRTIRSSDNNSDTTFIFQRTIPNITIDLNGTFSIPISSPNEAFAYGVGEMLDVDRQTVFLTLNEAKAIPMVGTVSGTSGTNTLTGVGTYFTRLNVGDRIEVTDVSGTFFIASITSDTSLTVSENFGSSFSGKTFEKVYIVGDVIDLISKGSNTGIARSVNVVSSTLMSINLYESFGVEGVGGTCAASISFLVSRNAALEIKKRIKKNRIVKIDCSTLISLTSSINLGFSDIIRIHQIRKHSSAFVNITDGINVTDHFLVDNGQRDDYYDHGKIIPTSSITLANTDHLLIELDYYTPDFTQGVGYFSVDSYPIDDSDVSDTTIFTHEIPVYKSTSLGTEYNLRDYMDFRSFRFASANDSITISGASTNPSNTTGFAQESSGLRIPYPTSRIMIDYSYYLARRDVVTLDKNGQFAIVRGVSAVNPVTPTISESVMGVANVYIPPYPSLSMAYARILNKTNSSCKVERITFARHTMRDIGVLKERITNLEYYSTVSLLEKKAVDMLIKDSNGLDRFKNGFFVDGFFDHSLGATYNSDYKIAIDEKEQVIRPFFQMNSFLYDYLETGSSNIQKTGNLLTLPYTETVFLQQIKATSYRNIEQSVFRFIGNLQLTPDTDVWCDTTTVDKTINLDLSENNKDSVLEMKWGSWEDHIAGYNVYQQKGAWTGLQLVDGTLKSDAELKGSFSDYASALAATKSYAAYGGGDPADVWNQHLNGVLETTTEGSRTGLKTTLRDKTTTEELGTFTTDVSLVPYIRAQVIRLFAKGLKANTRFHTFFDGENMNDYVTPMVIPENGPDFATNFLAEGSEWRSNDYGELLGMLRLPTTGKKFRVGSREIIITDTPTNAPDATTFCKNYFVAHGLIQQKQNTILSTKHTIKDYEIVTEKRTIKKVEVMGPSCMAYSFKVDAPEGEDGIFLTSVDVYIAALHATLGVWFEIREMNSAGGITRTQVPYSEVWMKRNDPRLVVTNDGSTPTNINFESPVFLMNDTQYAFVIHTEGLNPDTYFWVSRIGETDIVTGQQVTGRQLTGNVYTTNNNLNWDIVQDIDLKVRFNRAVFNTSVTGTLQMGNKSQEFFDIEEPTGGDFVLYGETVIGSEKLTLLISGGTDEIEIGDTIIGSSSSTTAEIVSVASGGAIVMTDKNGFSNSEAFTIADKDVTGNISSVQYGVAKLTSYDRRKNKLHLTESNGHFFENCTINGANSLVSSVINNIDRFPYSTIHYNPNYLVFTNTTCNFQIRGMRTFDNTFGNYYQVLPHTDFAFNAEKSVLSRSLELSQHSGNRSVQSFATLNTTSDWVSPIVDLSRTNSIFINNIINDDDTDEDKPSGGNLLNKYISKIVTLAEGQDAEDLLVSLTAYCPPGTTDKFPIKVWAKIKHREDAEEFANKPWIELENPGIGTYSSLVNKGDFKSFDFKFPSSMMTGLYDEVQYESNGNTFSGFKQFSVKIGLLGTNSAIVPKAADLRAIALQM